MGFFTSKSMLCDKKFRKNESTNIIQKTQNVNTLVFMDLTFYSFRHKDNE